MTRRLRHVAAAALAGFAHAAYAQRGANLPVPAEVRPFVEAGTRVLELQSGDLDGDGARDYILVLDRGGNLEQRQRPLILLKRGTDGRLAAIKRNENVVACASCGGAMGDPFEGVEIGNRSFVIRHYGGSSWRWSREYKFSYSRIDRTWQLVEVNEESFHASEPAKVAVKRHRPPRDFGKIDFADFDPENFLGRGPR